MAKTDSIIITIALVVFMAASWTAGSRLRSDHHRLNAVELRLDALER